MFASSPNFQLNKYILVLLFIWFLKYHQFFVSLLRPNLALGFRLIFHTALYD